MNDMENMRVFADQLWKYMVPKLKSMFASNVSYFRAKVVSNPGNNSLEVQRPVENGTLTLPCVDSVAHAQPGQQVVALVMGSMSNAIVIGDGKLNPPLSTYGTASTVTLESGKGGMPFNKLVSDITAVQEGSGDPSPENVRPIAGFTGMNLHMNDMVIAVDWQTEAGTVYGGMLDVLTGVLTVTHGMIVYDGSQNWTALGAGYYRQLTGMKLGLNNDESLCDKLPFIDRTTAPGIQLGYSGNNSPSVYIRQAEALLGVTTSAELKSWFADNPTTVVYPLAEPITYQLVPQQISSLPGQNTIWSDTGDVTVEYGQFLQAMQREIEKLKGNTQN